MYLGFPTDKLNMKKNLEHQLKLFWVWAGITPEEYALGELPEHAGQTEWEYDYPNWENLSLSIDEEAQQIKTGEQLDYHCFLEVVAIDYLSEEILHNFEQGLDEAIFLELIKQGLRCIQPYTRVQIVQMISRRNGFNPEHLYEQVIAEDGDTRVKVAALDALSELNRGKVEDMAITLYNTGDLKGRLAYYSVLKEIGYPKLEVLKWELETLAFAKIDSLEQEDRFDALWALHSLKSQNYLKARAKLENDPSEKIKSFIRYDHHSKFY